MARKATDAPMATDVDEVNPADGVGEGVLPVVVVVVLVLVLEWVSECVSEWVSLLWLCPQDK